MLPSPKGRSTSISPRQSPVLGLVTLGVLDKNTTPAQANPPGTLTVTTPGFNPLLAPY